MLSKRFSSITHLHIYAIINTLVTYRLKSHEKKINILDVGCGNGLLLSTLIKQLPLRHPDLRIDFYGLDVDDSHVQEKGFFAKTVSLLRATDPSVAWEEKVKLTQSDVPWPFEDNFFDIIFSNQVMEHVFNQSYFLNEIKRTMHKDGYSFHLYPLKHDVFEGHLLIPFAHKFKSWTSTYYWIKGASYLGMGKYKTHKKGGLCTSIEHFAERHADYLYYQVNYQTANEISKTAKACHLRASFDFSYLYYKQKFRSFFNLRPIEAYNIKDIRSRKNSFYFLFLKYVSSITLFITKKDTY